METTASATMVYPMRKTVCPDETVCPECVIQNEGTLIQVTSNFPLGGGVVLISSICTENLVHGIFLSIIYYVIVFVVWVFLRYVSLRSLILLGGS